MALIDKPEWWEDYKGYIEELLPERRLDLDKRLEYLHLKCRELACNYIEEKIKIDSIRFNGIIINDFDVETGRIETIWRTNYEKYRVNDLLEANLYVRDTYKNIRKKIQKCNISIKNLYGLNGIIKL